MVMTEKNVPRFTNNGKEVRRSLRNVSEEAVQQSKKGGKGGDGSVSEPKRSAIRGKGGASVSLSSPDKSRKSKRDRRFVEGISMLASTEASKTRRGTSYGGSPVSSPEKTTRRGTPYGGSPGSTLSPRQSKKQKLTPHKLKHHHGKFHNLHKLKHHRQERGEDGFLRSI
ncbi:hypothetical protein F2Q69_00011276 [Brassica cretica]|uniref:Uncharacterized protein n=1 Tax=Brassica cretica TaxID=69181 RepID=A0A8S9QQ51_BRACR|nr:hypothetical protein F2Q69_00011276 [Brassica cretica]